MPSTWIFGYGSLIFRPDFAHRASRPAWLWGFRRQLWQGSPDHRGTPDAPGRVATLVAAPAGRVLGLAFELDEGQLATALPRLDHREQAGYERLTVRLRPIDGGCLDALVYLATPGNPSWLGPADVGAIARHVASARGPSGENRAYVVELAAALVRLGLTAESDEEVLAVARALHEGPGEGVV
jgi:cation transport regulator ChaC